MANGGATCRLKPRFAVCAGAPESVAVALMVASEAVAGVPLSTPVELSNMPAGTPVADQVTPPVPPVEASCCAV